MYALQVKFIFSSYAAANIQIKFWTIGDGRAEEASQGLDPKIHQPDNKQF